MPADNQQGRKVKYMESKEGMIPEIGKTEGKKVYAYEISRDGGVNTTYVRADSLEEVQKIAEADLQERKSKSADPDVYYELHGEPYESDEGMLRLQELNRQKLEKNKKE